MSNKDINVDIDGVIVSIRSCGIIYNDDKVLLHKKEYDDFYALVGGRVKANESTVIALKREFYEELNINVDIINLLYCVENFFEYGGKKHHELMFVYLLKTDDIIPGGSFIKDENFFCWFDKNEFNSIKIKPDIFANWEELFSLKSKHIINIERELSDEDRCIEG